LSKLSGSKKNYDKTMTFLKYGVSEHVYLPNLYYKGMILSTSYTIAEVISEYGVGTYTTPDCAVTYLNHAQTTTSFAFLTHDCSHKL